MTAEKIDELFRKAMAYHAAFGLIRENAYRNFSAVDRALIVRTCNDMLDDSYLFATDLKQLKEQFQGGGVESRHAGRSIVSLLASYQEHPLTPIKSEDTGAEKARVTKTKTATCKAGSGDRPALIPISTVPLPADSLSHIRLGPEASEAQEGTTKRHALEGEETPLPLTADSCGGGK